MPTYGLRVRDPSGNIILDITDIVARIRYSNVVAADTSGSVELADISGKTVYPFSIPLEANKIAHSISISGTTFSWTHQSYSCPYFNLLSSQSLVGVIIVD
jgi:hypothetical protein